MNTSAPKRRSSWVFYAAVGLILLALPVAYFGWLDRPTAPTPPPVAAPPAPVKKSVELALGEVTGDVQVKKPGGPWFPAKKGELLGRDTAVRTGDGAYAVLVGGEAYEVRLEPGTQVSVEEITDSISRVLLGGGMATAKVASASKHVFEVRASGSDAVARTKGGAFAISNNAKGTVAVGTREGEVEFLGKGKVVIVRAGQQSIVRPGAAPTDPTTIPVSLLLKVRWPTAAVTTRKLVVSGEAEPGSLVRVGGRPALVDERGHFSSTLELPEGRNPVSVQAFGVGGGKAEDKKQLEVDTRGPSTRIDKDLWGEKK